jgi:hypothetical protein
MLKKPLISCNIRKSVCMILALFTSTSGHTLTLTWETIHVLSLCGRFIVICSLPRTSHDALFGSRSLHGKAVLRPDFHMTCTCTDVWLTVEWNLASSLQILCNSTVKTCGCVPLCVCLPLFIFKTLLPKPSLLRGSIHHFSHLHFAV